jgi:hypothetical protein
VLPSPTRFVVRDGDDELAGTQPWDVQPRMFAGGELSL